PLLAKPNHHAGLGEDVRSLALHALEEAQRRIIAGAGADSRIEPRHRLEVMVVDVRARSHDFLDGGFALVAKVRRQNLDRGLRRTLAKRLDYLDELPRAAVGKIVAIDGGDDDMLETKLRGCGCDMLRLERVDGSGDPRLHVAEGAGPGAGVAEDHHRRVLLGPALTNVRAGRFLAHRGEIEVPHQTARRVITFADRRLDANPVGLALFRGDGGWCVHGRADSDCRRGLPPLPSPR